MLNLFWIVLIVYLVVVGFYFSVKLGFKNFRFISMFKNMSRKYKEIFFVSIGTKIGVGSIIGTGIAIYTGGEGAIFWIWVFALLTSSWIYIESMLGSKFKKKLGGYYVSGPNFYIGEGLGRKKLANVFLFILTVAYSFFFLMIQTNTLSSIIDISFNFNKLFVFLFGFVILSLVTFSSIKEILGYINRTVPLMCIFLIVISVVVMVRNYSMIDDVFMRIVSSAFNFKSFVSGLFPTILIAIKRSIFQNELLIGTTSISSAVNSGDVHDIAGVQVLANLFISFVVCSLVGFLIIVFKMKVGFDISNYNELICSVFSYHFGSIGSIILLILIGLFSFTTVVSGFYFGLTNIMFLTNSRVLVFVFRVFVLLFTLSGFILNAGVIWWLIDFMMLVLIVINMLCITMLRKEVDYDR